MKRDEEWETCVPTVECSWKQIAEPVMKLYTETTDGSVIEDKDTAMVWSYEDSDPDFGSCQAKELLDHLESVLSNEPVTVKSGQNIVEVKPQVCVAIKPLSLIQASCQKSILTCSVCYIRVCDLKYYMGLVREIILIDSHLKYR